MKLKILNRWSGSLIFEAEADSLKLAVQLAVKQKVSLRAADLSVANLRDADLRDADLRDANLRDADLRDADLRDADLRDANLRNADLRVANLSAANLRDANLRNADLRNADLRDADLRDAKNVGDFVMADGLKFSEYLSDVVPALLTAGGKSLKEVLDTGCWQCHSWENCPMKVAFGINSSDEGPPLLRYRIREFVQFFDAKLIPEPKQQQVKEEQKVKQ